MELNIDNAYQPEMKNKQLPKQTYTNHRTGKTYQAHPSFSPKQYFDNYFTVRYIVDFDRMPDLTNPESLKDYRKLSPSTIQQISKAIDNLNIDNKQFKPQPNSTFEAQVAGTFAPSLDKRYNDDDTSINILTVNYQLPSKATSLGLKVKVPSTSQA